MRRVSRCQRRAAPRGQGASPPGACHRDGDPWIRLDVPELGLPLRAVSSSGTGRGRAGESCASGTSPRASARRLAYAASTKIQSDLVSAPEEPEDPDRN